MSSSNPNPSRTPCTDESHFSTMVDETIKIVMEKNSWNAQQLFCMMHPNEASMMGIPENI